MAGDSEITTLTRYIPVDAFLRMIENDIKNLIREYGHINCGLRHEELCEKLPKLIYQLKTPILSLMDTEGKEKWDREWRSKRKEFFNKLFQKEGFINMCIPKKYTDNPKLYQLKSKHIQFCKKRDAWKATVEKNLEYDACREYNSWINKQTTSLTREFLQNVRDSTLPVVTSYFSTKAYPQGYYPPDTYRHSKLDCTKYNPPEKSDSQRPTAKEPTNSIHPPTPPDVTQQSKEKNGKSVSGVDSESAKTEPHGNMPLKPKHSTDGSRMPSSTKTEPDDAANGEQTNVKAKGPFPPIKGDKEKKESTTLQGELLTDRLQTVRDEAPPQAKSTPLSPEDTSPTLATQSVPAAAPITGKNTTSSQTPVTSSSLAINSDSSPNSSSPLSSYLLPPTADAKGQDRALQSSTTLDTFATTLPNQNVPSTASADLSLFPPQAPVLTVSPAVTTANETGTSAFSNASAITTTVTTTTTSSAAVTRPIMSTAQTTIISTQQPPSASNSQEASNTPVSNGPKTTVPITDPHQTVAPTPTPVSGSDNGGVSVPTQPVTIDNNQQATLSSAPSLKIKDLIKLPGVQSENSITPLSEYTASGNEDMKSSKIQKTVGQTDIKHNIPSVQMGTNNDHDQLIHLVSVDPGKIPDIKLGKDHNNNPVTHKGKNDKPNIIPEGIPPLTHIIPSLLVILATITLLFQLYKYTPFGFLLGRRRKRKKRDLRSTFVIPEESTYESPNITVHEWEDPNLVGQTVENDVYTKLLKINRYKQEMQKRKKKNKKTLIEVHMEVLEEHKNDEWELHKGDFLEICLRGFINDENDFYSNFSNLKSILNNIKNEKTIEDIQKQEILWNNWIEDHRNILEQWKKEEWFHILKNEWRKEQQIYKEKKYKLQENTLNEQDTHSIISQKDIWKHWILKQATLIDLFNKEDWFKSLVYVQDEEKDNYLVNEYNNITVTNENQLKNEKVNHEHGRSKNIIKKLMVQIHMMVLEECIKEDIIKHKELCIDNFIEDTYNQNNYDENRNRPQCDTHDFSVPVYEEIHTSTNK